MLLVALVALRFQLILLLFPRLFRCAGSLRRPCVSRGLGLFLVAGGFLIGFLFLFLELRYLEVY
jgi:hypothetical protein